MIGGNGQFRALTEAMWRHRGATTDQLLALLRRQAIPVDIDTLADVFADSISAAEAWRRLSVPLKAPVIPKLRECLDSDDTLDKRIPRSYSATAVEVFACLRVLWERFCVRRPMFEQIEDLLIDGVQRSDPIERCTVWWEAWKTFKHGMNEWGYTSICSLDDRLNQSCIATGWLRGFFDQLSQAAKSAPQFHHCTIQLASDILDTYHITPYFQFSCCHPNAIAAKYSLGFWRSADSEVRELLKTNPDWREGWMLWAQSYMDEFPPGLNRYCPKLAENILHAAFTKLPNAHRDPLFFADLARVCRAQGKWATARKFSAMAWKIFQEILETPIGDEEEDDEEDDEDEEERDSFEQDETE